MNFARQLAAKICGSVRGQSKSLRTKSEAQNSAQFQDQSAKNQSTPAVKSNFEQNLDVQAHIAASIMPQNSRKLKVQEETSEILRTLGIKKSKPSNSSSWINQDWEDINDGNENGMAEKDSDEKGIRNEQLKTPEASSNSDYPLVLRTL
ncbi:hypothetical protein BY996DRAFT_6429066 [Phakopsora pachyrhizi]|nr:hypothetical protein BY996DRAFT_6429066 [Phakopsora pachyrhizi]